MALPKALVPPKGWMDYPALGSLIGSFRLLAFKVPLSNVCFLRPKKSIARYVTMYLGLSPLFECCAFRNIGAFLHCQAFQQREQFTPEVLIDSVKYATLCMLQGHRFGLIAPSRKLFSKCTNKKFPLS
jgi:hypothetical protein